MMFFSLSSTLLSHLFLLFRVLNLRRMGRPSIKIPNVPSFRPVLNEDVHSLGGETDIPPIIPCWWWNPACVAPTYAPTDHPVTVIPSSLPPNTLPPSSDCKDNNNNNNNWWWWNNNNPTCIPTSSPITPSSPPTPPPTNYPTESPTTYPPTDYPTTKPTKAPSGGGVVIPCPTNNHDNSGWWWWNSNNNNPTCIPSSLPTTPLPFLPTNPLPSLQAKLLIISLIFYPLVVLTFDQWSPRLLQLVVWW
jgi:hypothetical protein